MATISTTATFFDIGRQPWRATAKACLKVLLAAGLVVLVSACAETEFLMHTAKIMNKEATTSTGGRYKIGSPYQIAGTWYYPKVDYNYDETGIASWYGPNFHGKRTANGEVYDMNRLTAAHRTLPMPSIVEVTNLDNGRTLRLEVNDRGPYAKGRIIDISKRGAQLLGFQKQGTARVRVRIVADASRRIAEQLKSGEILTDGGSPITVDKLPKPAVDSQVLAPPGEQQAAAPPPAETVASASHTAKPAVETAVDLTQPEVVTLEPVAKTSIYIQAGAFSQFANANRASAILSSVGEVKISPVLINGMDLFRVRLGPLKSVEEADALLNHVVASGYVDARIIVD